MNKILVQYNSYWNDSSKEFMWRVAWRLSGKAEKILRLRSSLSILSSRCDRARRLGSAESVSQTTRVQRSVRSAEGSVSKDLIVQKTWHLIASKIMD